MALRPAGWAEAAKICEIPMYEGPIMAVSPLLHDCAWAHSMTSPASVFSRVQKAHHVPSEEPVPRASTVRWRYPRLTR